MSDISRVITVDEDGDIIIGGTSISPGCDVSSRPVSIYRPFDMTDDEAIALLRARLGSPS